MTRGGNSCSYKLTLRLRPEGVWAWLWAYVLTPCTRPLEMLTKSTQPSGPAAPSSPKPPALGIGHAGRSRLPREGKGPVHLQSKMDRKTVQTLAPLPLGEDDSGAPGGAPSQATAQPKANNSA